MVHVVGWSVLFRSQVALHYYIPMSAEHGSELIFDCKAKAGLYFVYDYMAGLKGNGCALGGSVLLVWRQPNTVLL